jgi:hypothetical protein
VTAGPFAALGLPARPDLTDDDIRAAWRRIAAATHPDRADGGDPARFAAAAAAYTELRTRYGRGEAYADLTTGNGPVPETRQRPGPARPLPRRETTPHRETAPHADAAPHGEAPSRGEAASRGETAGHRDTTAGLAARVRRGRPALLALRIAIAAAITVAAFAILGALPAAAGLAAGALTWLLLTARHDLAPPGT